MNEKKTSNRVDKALNTNPKRFIIGGLIIVLVFFGGLGAWSALFPFAGAVIAPGTVKVSQERKTIQHLEGGIVDEILVKEGDKVDKGQVLVRLKSSQINASVSLLQGRLWAQMAKADRLEAESRLKGSIDWKPELLQRQDNPDVVEVMAKEKDIFASRREDLQGKISLHRSQIDQLNEKIEGAKEELNAQKEIIAILNEEIAAKEELYKDRYIDKAKILELKRMLSERKGRAGSLKQTIAETRQKIEELKLRIVDLRNTYREKAVTELGKVTDAVFQLREQIRPKLDAKQRLEIKAPITGEVLNMRVHSEDSGVVKPGEPILDIVPEQAELIVEARIRLDQITDVFKGQSTKVQLSAFNRRTTPPIPGEVVYVSADQLEQRTSRGNQAFYNVHVQVDQQELEESGAYLSPGMPVVCYITTEERTVIGYLLEPILEVVDKSMRES